MREDFTIKLRKDEVSCYQEYYAKAKERSVAMSVKVAENMVVLKNIEKSMRVEPMPLSPIPLMLDTLIDYCQGTEEHEPTTA